MVQTNDLSIHLEELRRRLISILIFFAACSVLSFCFSDSLIEWMVRPIAGAIQSLYFLSPYEAFLIRLKISAAAGLVLSLPLIFYHFWAFVRPGLFRKEANAVVFITFFSVLCFLIGAVFAYVLAIPFALRFFLGFESAFLRPLISIAAYTSFFVALVLAFGLMFELPVILIGLIWLGVLGSSFLAAQRKTAIVLILILAALVTPTVDVITQCLLALPLWLLYELSLFIGRIIERSRRVQKRG